MLNWVQPFNIFCLLDNRQYHFEAPAFECLLAVGCKRKMDAGEGDTFELLKAFSRGQNDWIFGHLGYDLKNEIDPLSSANFDGINFPDAFFFVPEIVLQVKEHEVIICCDSSAADIFSAIDSSAIGIEKTPPAVIEIQQRVSLESYTEIIKKIQQHILRGDCYEVNFCQEFFAQGASINPFNVYRSLVNLSPNPFAALYRLNDKFCICASPERYFKKSGRKIFSQPMKGTAQRNLSNPELDEFSKQSLQNSEKEKSENVMVVDLVRNDLSRVCKRGSVRVDELFGIYSFPQVHQMISTISGELEGGLDWVDLVKATFPMGSMTGAPKLRVLELIERYESTRRGLFSGAIGYVNPAGDADFNVVIRSILYNASADYLSFQTGSAITFYSNAEAEYEECMLKARAMQQVLQQT